MRQHRGRRIVAIAGLVALEMLVLAAFVLTALNLVVTRSAEGQAFDDVAELPHKPVAIVFGAGVVDGQPTPALGDRINGAVALYTSGKVDHLLMTGDNSRVDYDEVTVMRDRAIRAGVPADAITRDYAGFNTYDSCVRARAIFGVESAVLVTQDYHLSRALYLCRQQGIDAVGLSIPDWQHHAERLTFEYPSDLQRSYTGREWLARAKAVIDSRLLHPSPTFLGPIEGLRPT